MQRPLTLLSLAVLSIAGINLLRKKQAQRLVAQPKARAKPEALQTWEGEGGGLLNGAADPTTTAAARARDAAVFADAAQRDASA